jgi:hypothetical protein
MVGGALDVIRDFRRPYVAINVSYNRLILMAMLAAAVCRRAQGRIAIPCDFTG